MLTPCANRERKIMSASEPKYVVVRFGCQLPAEVMIGQTHWRVILGYYNKGHRAEIIATSSDGRRGNFADGRANEVERLLRLGMLVPVGTMRYRIALAFAAEGRAMIELADCGESPWS